MNKDQQFWNNPSTPPEEAKRCRLCLEKCTSSVEIFKDEFPKMIYNLTRLKVWPDDRMPNISCIPCALEVKQAMLVRKKILTSYKALLAENVNLKNNIQPKLNNPTCKLNNNNKKYNKWQKKRKPLTDPVRYDESPPPLAPLSVVAVNYSEMNSNNYETQNETICYIPDQDSNFNFMASSTTDGNLFEFITKNESIKEYEENCEYEQIIIAVEQDQHHEEIIIKEEDFDDAPYLQQTFEVEEPNVKKKRLLELNTDVHDDILERIGSEVTVKFRRKRESQNHLSKKVPCNYCNKMFANCNLRTHLSSCPNKETSRSEVDLIPIPLQVGG